jgi:mannitol-specific phosphotransferase system IIBC component
MATLFILALLACVVAGDLCFWMIKQFDDSILEDTKAGKGCRINH